MVTSLLLIFFAQAQEYTWWDGDKQKKSYLIKNKFIDFSRNTLPETISRPRVRISGAYLVEATAIETEAFLSATPKLLSPAFANTKNGSIARALPGGILIRFKPEVSEENQEKWFLKNELKVLRTTKTIAGKLFLIETPSGISSLEIANQIYQDSMIEFSTPNWWNNLKLM